jgi:hypothetical protein
MIGNQEVPPTGDDKTSIIVSMSNKPGALHELLVPFHDNGIDLTRIETRPSRSGKWTYVFFIDFVGHHRDPLIKVCWKDQPGSCGAQGAGFLSESSSLRAVANEWQFPRSGAAGRATTFALRSGQTGGRTGARAEPGSGENRQTGKQRNPLGASPKALAAIRDELAELTRYPDGNGFALKSLLAEQCRVELNQDPWQRLQRHSRAGRARLSGAGSERRVQ